MQPGKIDFCHICSQRFTITAYTKQSPDGEGLLCSKCGSVEQSAAKKEAPKRRRTKIGKGTAKMILEGKDDRIGKLQDACIKVSSSRCWLTIGHRPAHSRCRGAWRHWGCEYGQSTCLLIPTNTDLSNHLQEPFSRQ
jgi:hypothetical protein